MAYGQIEYILRDAATEEIIEQGEKSNILNDKFFEFISDYGQLPLRVVITDAIMEASRITNLVPGTTNPLPVITVIPSIGVYAQYFPRSGATPAFIQYSGRYTAPAIGTSRTIKSICLASGYNQQSSVATYVISATDFQISYLSPSPCYAFSKLSAPCIQTDTQVLDVFYRVFFPYNASSGLAEPIFEKLVASFLNYDNVSVSYPMIYSPFKLPKIKSYDTGRVPVSQSASHVMRSYNGKAFFSSGSKISGAGFFRQLNYTNANFTDFPGIEVGSLISFNNTARDYSYGSQSQLTLASYSNMDSYSKIQNMIGQATELSGPLNLPFLDVDNLPTGTGIPVITGTWNNISTPSGAGLYYPGKMPELVRVKIESSGSTGTSTYSIIRQKFLGLRMYANNPNMYHTHCILPLCGEDLVPTGNLTTSGIGTTLIGDITDTTFGVRQLSACEKYDESSIIIVKKNEIILYNIAVADYWRYTGAFTNIHQVAVVNSKIYVACRDTGLYVIDPYNSLTVSAVANTAGIDFSICNGVARGYNNRLWVAANNCIASFDGSTWLKYDSSSSPQFSIAGISDSNWSNIEFIKVDEFNVDNQMLIVRKSGATVNPTLLGVWWSLTTAAANTGAEPQSVFASNHLGWPRFNRRHVGGSRGLWAVITQNTYRVFAFNGTTFTATPISYTGLDTDGQRLYQEFQAVNFVQAPDTTVRLLTFNGYDGGGNIPNTGIDVGTSTNGSWYRPRVKLVDGTGIITHTLSNHGLSFSPADTGSTYDGGTALTALGSGYPISSISLSLVADKNTWFELSPGLIISITGINGYWSNSGSPYNTPATVQVRAFCYGNDYSPSGGTLNWLARQTYGWTGSAWQIGAPPRTTHTTTEPLFDGLSVSFQSGQSYVSPNVYKFGLFDGLLKDNATRATFKSMTLYHCKTFKDATDTQFATVPASTAGLIGNIGFDPYNASGGVYLDGSNQVVLPGQNFGQYARGDKDLVGDFIININATNMLADVKQRRCTSFGVTRRDFDLVFGFYWNNGSLQAYDNGQSDTSVSTAGLTSLEIRRTAGTMTAYRNGALIKTSVSSLATGAANYRLNAMYSTPAGSQVFRNVSLYFPEGMAVVPLMTITANGADISMRLGNPSTRTGAYSDRFYSLDIYSNTLSIKLNGVLAVLKYNGTAPAAGEVSIDQWTGIAHFNVADVGKTVDAVYTYLTTA